MQLQIKRHADILDGYPLEEFTLTNEAGFSIRVSGWGATWMDLIWPDGNGGGTDVLLGYDTIKSWIGDPNKFGSTCGRVCNRIKNSTFAIDGHVYYVSANIPPDHLHGGHKGFDQKNWRAYPELKSDLSGIRMFLISREGEEGYPGNLAVEAFIGLTETNEVVIEYSAETDHTTLCSLTSHPYFNLSGSETILDHTLTIDSDQITLMDQNLLTLEKLVSVENTPFDFRKPALIGSKMDLNITALRNANGFDQNYVLSKKNMDLPVAVLMDKRSNRELEIYTDQAGLQFYSGNHLATIGKKNKKYGAFAGLCLETQAWPNAAQYSSFPSILLRPGEKYRNRTRIKCNQRS
jgi:aldose 1-epimerase